MAFSFLVSSFSGIRTSVIVPVSVPVFVTASSSVPVIASVLVTTPFPWVVSGSVVVLVVMAPKGHPAYLVASVLAVAGVAGGGAMGARAMVLVTARRWVATLERSAAVCSSVLFICLLLRLLPSLRQGTLDAVPRVIREDALLVAGPVRIITVEHSPPYALHDIGQMSVDGGGRSGGCRGHIISQLVGVCIFSLVGKIPSCCARVAERGMERA